MQRKTWTSRIALCLLFVSVTLQAGIPVWLFSPLTATSAFVRAGDTVSVQYQVTNQSSKPHTLEMQSIQGLTQVTTGSGVCGSPFALAGKASCTLSLLVTANQVAGSITQGPVVCQQGATNQCYQPSYDNSLSIHRVDFTVSPTAGPESGGTGITITGANLAGTTAVSIHGQPATFVNQVNDTTVTAVTPAYTGRSALPVTVPVIATTASGDETGLYIYQANAAGGVTGGGLISCLGSAKLNLIATSLDTGLNVQWATSNDVNLFVNGTDENDGANNTALIIAKAGLTAPAAQLCDDYEIDSQGNTTCQAGNECYDDWFLPATTQLSCMSGNASAIGGSLVDTWTSFERINSIPNVFSDYLVFGMTIPLQSGPVIGKAVRCAREFTP